MEKSQTKQNTQLEYRSYIEDVRAINGILYFTLNLEKKGRQRWKNDGISSTFITYI